MSVRFTSVKCPECGASLPIEEGRSQVFCSYCGTKILITNENEHIYRHVDEARIKQAETDRIIRMRELDLAEKSNRSRKTLTTIWLIVSLILLVIAIGIMFLAGDGGLDGFLFLFYVCGPIIGGGAYLVFKVLPEKENEKVAMSSGGIRFPQGLEPFSEKNYEAVLIALKNAGFGNITCINLHDLTFGIIQKPGKIDKITVDGKEITSSGKVYMPDAAITITYHGK